MLELIDEDIGGVSISELLNWQYSRDDMLQGERVASVVLADDFTVKQGEL